jgi:hypothetical protein
VNGAAGSDDSDGLTEATAFRTITKAYTTIRGMDLSYRWVVLQLADGVYAESLDMAGHLVGKHLLGINGNLADPSKVVWRAGSAGHCIFVSTFACATIAGITFEAPGSNALVVSQAGILDIGSPVVFGVAGCHVVVTDGGYFNVTGAYSISGSAVHHLITRGNGHVRLGGSVTPVRFTERVTFASFLHISQGSVVATNGTPVDYENPELCTGTKYVVTSKGVLADSGTMFPGTIDGITDSDAAPAPIDPPQASISVLAGALAQRSARWNLEIDVLKENHDNMKRALWAVAALAAISAALSVFALI